MKTKLKLSMNVEGKMFEFLSYNNYFVANLVSKTHIKMPFKKALDLAGIPDSSYTVHDIKTR